MIKSGIKYFWMIAAVFAVTSVCLASGEKEPDWSYIYTDDFQDCNVENDSYYHSIFWPQGAFPPEAEPYLYFKNTGQARELGFGDFHGTPAQLVYRFPFEQEQKTISGELQVDVRFLYTGTGSLRYSLSSDGKNWSNYKELVSGTNVIPLESIRGICYISFYGIGVLIDNLEVNLYSYPADYFVEPDAVSPKFATIQGAIDYAIAHTSYDDKIVIEVAPGTYSGNGNHDIDFKGRKITLYSEEGAGQTIIKCQDGQRGFYFHLNENQNSVLRGFKIINGKKTGSSIPSDTASWSKSSSYPVGGGIYCEFSSPGIIDCIIQSCSTEYGGGIGLVAASPYIADCIIQNCNAGGFGSSSTGGYGAGIALIRDSNAVIINTAIKGNKGYNNSKGAGVYCYQSKALLANCDISSNIATNYVIGGGVYAEGAYTNIELKNCIIADNIAQSGAGIYTDSINTISNQYASDDEPNATACFVRVTNCTIANNKSGGGVFFIKSNIKITNSIIWGNQGLNVRIDEPVYNSIDESRFDLISYSDIQGGYEGEGNIDANPLFAPVAGDYHLQSHVGRFNPSTQSWVVDDVNSPCLDAGNPDDSIGAETYQHGKRINMGAYGGTEYASMNYTPCLIHVATRDTTGSDSHDGTSREDAFATIQDAVKSAKTGDIIMIWPGTYYEGVSFKGKAITIQSADEAAVVVANQDQYAYAFWFNSAESRNSVLRNLIIKNSTGKYGGAIYCDYASPTLKNLTIVNNFAGVRTFNGASPIVKNCIFRNNTNGDYDATDPFILRSISYCRLDKLDGLLSDSHNITSDPRFVDNNSNFHLQSNSKCIDAGDGDFSREPLPNGGKINLGAYGGTPFASKSSTLFSDTNN